MVSEPLVQTARHSLGPDQNQCLNRNKTVFCPAYFWVFWGWPVFFSKVDYKHQSRICFSPYQGVTQYLDSRHGQLIFQVFCSFYTSSLIDSCIHRVKWWKHIRGSAKNVFQKWSTENICKYDDNVPRAGQNGIQILDSVLYTIYHSKIKV